MATTADDSERRLLLRPHSGAPRQARDFVADACRDWGVPGFRSAATLAVSELVTNAVRHADTEIRLRLALAPDGLTIAVHDLGAGRPYVVPAARRATGGRGLAMVERLAEAWGVRADGEGKWVWCRLTDVSGRGTRENEATR